MLAYQENKKGFTLIETLVAVLILVLAITGPLSLYSRFISQADALLNSYVAYYLAEEGYFTMYQKLYDSLRIVESPSEDQLSVVSGCNTSSGGCALNYDGTIINTACTSGNEARCSLYQEPNKRFTHLASGNVATIFQRIVSYRTISPEGPGYCAGVGGTLTPPVAYAEIQIISRVRWLEDGVWKEIAVSRSLFDPADLATRCGL